MVVSSMLRLAADRLSASRVLGVEKTCFEPKQTKPMSLRFAALAVLALLCGRAVAEDVPLPRPRPPEEVIVPADLVPSACQQRLTLIAQFDRLPSRIGPGACGGSDLVQLKSVTVGGSVVTVTPPAELRCEMAEQIAIWIRDDAAGQFAPAKLTGIDNFDSYECRGRNRVVGATVSEHGKGNALDIRAFRLAGNKVITPTDVNVARELRVSLRQGACARFTTVLGPGSDGYHESHIHLDIAARRGGYRICSWAVRDLGDVGVAHADIPLPLPRPYNLGNDKPSL
jgi:hypothetical protein